ncbi:unnamed protein product [Gongylonema pulchrum]|uniref:Ground-like domain-containing protein n=1 Tax=Gongylonema pulchrum TaxID=637853 RepID=A0A3P7NH23_9BILA|nr:unnamed protein product [Gongylonema pulchrum]
MQADKDLVEIYKKIKKIRNQGKAVQHAVRTSNPDVQPADPKCISVIMREAIIENIDPSPATAKRKIQKAVSERIDGNIDTICSTGSFSYLIQKAVSERIDGNIDTICSTGSFSYLVNTDLYCEIETADITCLVFRQTT